MLASLFRGCLMAEMFTSRPILPGLRYQPHFGKVQGAVKGTNKANNTCDVWTEYYDMAYTFGADSMDFAALL
uniref:Uncharacterized protein n=1 Tax=Solanum lycopersicum TaxID=4081 RepID=A0A3Q7F515_SOLLC